MEDNSTAAILATLMVEETNSSIKYEIKASGCPSVNSTNI